MIKQLLLGTAVAAALGVAPVQAGDVDAGKAKAAPCGACHGADGNSPAPSFPKLAGQGEKYLIKQMQDIKSGLRPVPTMAGQLDNMSAEDFADIAAYYAAQTVTVGQADAELVELGEQIYRGGIRERDVPACSGCHSPTGVGNAPAAFPALGGQHAAYTESQLKAFRKASEYSLEQLKAYTRGQGDPSGRVNDGDEVRTMRTIAFRLSDKEIKAVSSYAEGLSP